MKKIEKVFLSSFEENEIELFDNKYLLAISGGIDSMVLLNLFQKFELNFSVSTCNFQLRGKDSNEDVNFVKSYCQKNKIKFYSEDFNVLEHSKKNKISIQMSSRDLRYTWFKGFLNAGYNYIVTAHHSDDNVETILYNFLKTTGYKGLVGIPKSSNNIFRPLLKIDKDDIRGYAKLNKLNWREDYTNGENKYLRNKIRNKIIPIFSEINPSFKDSIRKSVDRLGNIQKFINEHKKKFISNYVTARKNFIEIDKSFLEKEDDMSVIINDYLSDYGFNYDQISLIILALSKRNNSKFFSDKYVLINDRKSFYIFREKIFKKEKVEIKGIGIVNVGSKKIEVKKYSNKLPPINRNKNNAQCDYDKVCFPVVIRNYKKGEKFQPLGMKNTKKISSFLSDNKVSFIDKMDQLVAVDAGGTVIWLVGQQINDKIKINSNTQNILEFEII